MSPADPASTGPASTGPAATSSPAAPPGLRLPSYERPAGVHPPLSSPEYRSTLLRAPKRPAVRLPHGLTEVTGPGCLSLAQPPERLAGGAHLANVSAAAEVTALLLPHLLAAARP